MKNSCAVITISGKVFAGEREDESSPAICEIAEENGFEVKYKTIVPDDTEMIKAELIKCADELKINLVLTTGGTGFSPQDVTPEATLAVIERETVGIPEAMRTGSLRFTSHACLSRGVAGIRGRTLIINLPGSRKAAEENLSIAISAVRHSMDMLASSGSEAKMAAKKTAPSADAWLYEAKASPEASQCGMFLFHNGVVRASAKARVRQGDERAMPVKEMEFSYDGDKVNAAIENARKLPGIYYVRVWLNSGRLNVGDDIMLVLIGGDIRPHVTDALGILVGEIKTNCVTEREIY
jgi:molybdopterin adenylyltransferase